MNRTLWLKLLSLQQKKVDEIGNIPPPPARKMDFMAVQEDIPKPEKEVIPAPALPSEPEVKIPLPPQAKPEKRQAESKIRY